MNKKEFLSELSKKLSGLSCADAEERLNFYSEMIDDRMEEGLSEEEAVAAIGSLEDIATQISEQAPVAEADKEKKTRPKRTWRTWKTILLAVGSPVWVSLLIAVAAVVFSLWISAWAVVVSLWSGFGSLVGGSIGGLVCGVGSLILGHSVQGMVLISAGLVLAGLAIFCFFGCRAATRGMIALTSRLAVGIQRLFVKEERYE